MPKRPQLVHKEDEVADSGGEVRAHAESLLLMVDLAVMREVVVGEDCRDASEYIGVADCDSVLRDGQGEGDVADDVRILKRGEDVSEVTCDEVDVPAAYIRVRERDSLQSIDKLE